jgi:multiple antibiotic resistance protein
MRRVKETVLPKLSLLCMLIIMEWIVRISEQLISLKIFLPFIPLFVAFNVLGILPIFSSLTSEMVPSERKRVIRQSILTAFLVSIGFLGAGKSVFALLEISVADFQIAGIPLIVGPAVLTLLLIVIHTYGYISTLLCLILNLLVVWLVFGQSHWIMRLMKEGGAKGIGKVSALLLAAFAMMMIRKGLEGWIGLFN